jgi:Tfp pilus assembly protein PilN
VKQLLESLPVKKRKELKIWALVTVLLFSVAALFAVVVLSSKMMHLIKVKKEFNILNNSLGDFEVRLKEKNKLEKDSKDLEDKLKRLQHYSANGAKVAAALLKSICKVIPEQLFLDQFDFDYKKQALRLTGYCQDVFVLTSFVDQISEFDFCRNVRLEKLSRSTLEDYVLQFVILLQLKEF